MDIEDSPQEAHNKRQPVALNTCTRAYLRQVVLSLFDRVAIGSELLLFRWKQLETTETGSPPSAEMAVMEFKRALQVSGV